MPKTKLGHWNVGLGDSRSFLLRVEGCLLVCVVCSVTLSVDDLARYVSLSGPVGFYFSGLEELT